MSEKEDIGVLGTGLSRRNFMVGAAATGLSLMLEKSALGQAAAGAAPSKDGDLKIAMIGVGRQGGDNLMRCCLKIPGVRFVAACDIWECRRTYAQNLLKKYKQPINVYEDYREMLDKEKDLDAVIVASPDWMHAEHTNACLRAGKHVYCEKEMSNSIEGAKSMVLAARETKKLLQIGHQRRSNPRYLHALKMVNNDKVLGRITNFQGQWNREVNASQDLGWAKSQEIPAQTLKKYGYESMQQFRNWRWFKKFAGGPIVDLGSHQIDVFSWFLKANPKAVMASGGADYYKDREWYDDVLVIYEFETAAGPVRGFYQVLNTSSYGGFYEVLMGDAGSIVISEDVRKGQFFPEAAAKKRDWQDMSENKSKTDGKDVIDLKIGETLDPSGKKSPEGQKLLADLSTKPVHQFHLENFFDAIRKGTPLNCPPEVGYESAVAVLKVNEAIAAGKRLEFGPKEFTV